MYTQSQILFVHCKRTLVKENSMYFSQLMLTTRAARPIRRRGVASLCKERCAIFTRAFALQSGGKAALQPPDVVFQRVKISSHRFSS